MHSGHTRLGQDFLIDVFPHRHMVLYNAVSGVKGFNEKAADFIRDLKEKGESVVTGEMWRGEERLTARRALAILAKLFEKGYDNLLLQYEKCFELDPVLSPADGIVLQLGWSSRWERKYETAIAYDVILAVPEWGRVVALSTTDITSESDPSLISRFERVHIENFHFYPFFNRAHGVRGRKVVQGQCGVNGEVDLVRDFSFLLRTCADAKMIGKSIYLPAFTPVVTVRGLQLGFYFASLCKIREVGAIPSATGFGTDLGKTQVTLFDGSGDLKANLSTPIFIETMGLSCNQPSTQVIKDPLDLPKYTGWVLILSVWLFGQETPYIAAMQFLGDNVDTRTLLLEASMNTIRKARLASPASQVGTPGTATDNLPKHVVINDGWGYFVQSGWHPAVFLAMVKNGFIRLGMRDALKTGVTLADRRECERSFRLFTSINPWVLELYQSEDPKGTLQRIFLRDPKGDHQGRNPLSELYRCPRCRTTFIESQFQPGKVKRCMKCGALVEPFDQENRHMRTGNTTPRRFKASRFLGSDDWLKSLFD